MKSLYITGGRRRKEFLKGSEARSFREAVVLNINPDTRCAKTCTEYVSPPDTHSDNPSILFKTCTLLNDRLYVCTETEVLIYSFPDFELVNYISLPCFNDVHHVLPTADETLLIANTGLDMVLDVTLDGKLVREWNVLGKDPWGSFSRSIDYRKISTKPHRSHPNYIFTLGEDIWVTRFEQRDAVCLTGPNRKIHIGIERPHDGIVDGSSIYFTTVDGHIVIADAYDLEVKRIVDLNAIHTEDKSLGWCRGLLIEDDRLWVGFSRLRPTKFRETVSWVKHGFNSVGIYNTLPTRIVCYDLPSMKRLTEIDLEPFDLHAVFSIVSA